MPKVVATARGYFEGQVREPGEEFDVSDEVFKTGGGEITATDKDTGELKRSGKFRPSSWFKLAEEAEAKPAKKAKGKDKDSDKGTGSDLV
jgi:hypothetical protein